ncbi:MAG: hypothetical protein U1E87_09485 [Alphaproteobacteria bacterium]
MTTTTGSAHPRARALITGNDPDGHGKVGPDQDPTYTYDDNGNLSSGGGRSIDWTVFNMVECIVSGSGTLYIQCAD